MPLAIYDSHVLAIISNRVIFALYLSTEAPSSTKTRLVLTFRTVFGRQSHVVVCFESSFDQSVVY